MPKYSEPNFEGSDIDSTVFKLKTFEVGEAELNQAQNDKFYAKKINDLYKRVLDEQKKEASTQSERIRAYIEHYRNELALLKTISDTSVGKAQALKSQEESKKAELNRLTSEFNQAPKPPKYGQQLGASQGNLPPPPPEGSPPPPPPGGPLPPIPSQSRKLKINKRNNDEPRTAQAPTFNPAEFNPSAGLAKLRSVKRENAPSEGTQNSSAFTKKRSKSEEIKDLINKGTHELQAQHAKLQRNLDSDKRILSELYSEFTAIRSNIINYQRNNLEAALLPLIELEDRMIAAYKKEVNYLNERNQLELEIKEANIPLKLPEITQPIANQMDMPPPPPPPGGLPPLKESKKPINNRTTKQNKDNKGAAASSNSMGNALGEMATSPLFSKKVNQAREQEAEIEAELNQKNAAERKQQIAQLVKAQEKMQEAIKKAEADTPDDPKLQALVNEYKDRFKSLQSKLNKIIKLSEVDHVPEIKFLREKLEHDKMVQKEDYNRRLAERNNEPYEPNDVPVLPEPPAELTVSLEGVSEEPLKSTQPQPQSQMEQFSTMLSENSLKDDTASIKDKKQMIENFLSNYSPGFTSNKNRKAQVDTLNNALKSGNENKLDTVIKQIKDQMFNQDGTLKPNETRWLGKSKLEELITAYDKKYINKGSNKFKGK